jgi:hypothetical protein
MATLPGNHDGPAHQIAHSPVVQGYMDAIKVNDAAIASLRQQIVVVNSNIANVQAQILAKQQQLTTERAKWEAILQTCLNEGQTPEQIADNVPSKIAGELVGKIIQTIPLLEANIQTYEADIARIETKIATIEANSAAIQQQLIAEYTTIIDG